jgi:hypothetical protein
MTSFDGTNNPNKNCSPGVPTLAAEQKHWGIAGGIYRQRSPCFSICGFSEESNTGEQLVNLTAGLRRRVESNLRSNSP